MKSLGIYVHFPWCLKKCPYCDFLSVTAKRPEIPHRDYADAVVREAEQRISELATTDVHSVFFGGGTPSLWEPAELGRVLDVLRRKLAFSATTEVTVECNPTSFSVAHARALADVGVNRVSIGVQSLDTERLEFLGRLHDVDGGLAAVRDAVASGMPNVSADLIYGVYRQAPERAAAEVRAISALGVTHLSAYALTIEPGTQFGARAKAGALPLLSDDLVAESFDAVSETLQSEGFHHYEISNFARAGRRCRHNLGYWRGEEYLGLGCGAWGTLRAGAEPRSPTSIGRTVRYRNTVSPERYMVLREFPWPEPDALGEGYQTAESLDARTLLAERLLLGLRLAEGIRPKELELELGIPVLTKERRAAVERLVRARRLEVTEELWRIPHSAWLFADAVIRDLM